MTVAEYREHPALNYSLAKTLLQSPAHFKAAQDEEREETDAMRIGTIAHAAVLEGKCLLDLFAIKPVGMSFASKEGKAWRDSQTLPILKEEDANSIPRVAEAIIGNPHASTILKACQHRETPIFGTIMGVPCKCLLDAHGTEWGDWSIADFKTALDASPKAFGKQVANMHLDLQMAWYQTLLALDKGIESPPLWTWIVAEKKAPFYNMVYTGGEFVESGMRKLETVLTLYKKCTEEDHWPFATSGILSLPRPSWA